MSALLSTQHTTLCFDIVVVYKCYMYGCLFTLLFSSFTVNKKTPQSINHYPMNTTTSTTLKTIWSFSRAGTKVNFYHPKVWNYY